MDNSEFQKWLQDEKKMSVRSSGDVICRIKRVMSIVHANEVNENTLGALNSSEEFLKCSMFIKSQLRRAVTLYNEFNN